MRALRKFILIMAGLFLLLMPACSQAEPPQPTQLPQPPTVEEQQVDEGSDSATVLEVTMERPTAEAPSPEPSEEPTEAPPATATPTIMATPTSEPPTPQATMTAAASAEAPDSEEEATATIDVTSDETVSGAVFGNSGTTADLVERGISLDVTGIAETYGWLVVPLSEEVENPLPRHILLTFDDDDPEQMMDENGRRTVLFPVRPYLALYNIEGQSDVADQVARLGELIDTAQERTSDADLPPGDWMPLLPLVEDGRLQTWEQFADVDFASGRGVRFLSDTTGVLTYYYQGLSEGDRYYVSLFWPLVGEEVPELQALDGLVSSFTIGERGE